MKQFAQKIVALVLIYHMLIIVACQKCSCPPTENKQFKLKAIKAENILWKNPPTNQYDYQTYDKDTLPATSYGIKLTIETQTVFLKQVSNYCSFINQAYACDCATSSFKITDSIVGIEILAQNDIGSISKGTDMKSSFSVLYTTHNNKIAYLPCSEIVSEFNNASMNNLILPVQIICTDKSLKGNLASFTVLLQSKAGVIFSTNTKTVYLE